MRWMIWTLSAVYFFAATGLAAADDPFKHWTRKQLESKVKQLLRKNRELKSKLASGEKAPVLKTEASTAPAGSATELVKAPSKKVWLLDDFEKGGPEAANGQSWVVVKDDLGLGSKIEADWIKGKKGKALRVQGFMPANEAPWPWVVAELPLSEKQAPTDLRGYTALEFWVKGDGKMYQVKMHRMAVKDFAYPFVGFTAPAKWTKVTLALDGFAQADWAVQVSGGLMDVHQIIFAPLGDKTAFDFSIDNLRFIK